MTPVHFARDRPPTVAAYLAEASDRPPTMNYQSVHLTVVLVKGTSTPLSHGLFSPETSKRSVLQPKSAPLFLSFSFYSLDNEKNLFDIFCLILIQTKVDGDFHVVKYFSIVYYSVLYFMFNVKIEHIIAFAHS